VRKKRNKPLSVSGSVIPSDTDAHKEEHFRASVSASPGWPGLSRWCRVSLSCQNCSIKRSPGRTLPARRFLLIAGSRSAADRRIPSLRLSLYGLLHPSHLILGFGG
jgi:hypothetical protein